MKKLLIILSSIIFFIQLSLALPIAQICPVNTNVGNVNSSAFWDNLDSPADILSSDLTGLINASGHITTTKVFCGNITGGSDSDYCTDNVGNANASFNESYTNTRYINIDKLVLGFGLENEGVTLNNTDVVDITIEPAVIQARVNITVASCQADGTQVIQDVAESGEATCVTLENFTLSAQTLSASNITSGVFPEQNNFTSPQIFNNNLSISTSARFRYINSTGSILYHSEINATGCLVQYLNGIPRESLCP